MKRALIFALASAAAVLLFDFSAPARSRRVAFAGDPQVDDRTELDFARRSVYSELAARRDIGAVIFLGDLVNEKPELLEPSRRILDSLGKPWFCVAGNHDRDPGKGERGTRAFSAAIGPADTAFTMNGIRFILMNNVRTGARGGYEGGFTRGQMDWLA